ncbi:DUF4446 family protein [Candidatus Azambacteria bacterium]|nr:DUF4446 family protein [Candidatus Azambacteria bacterium]MBI3684998.1 DUF4446 family protein [Candidatus Azambacteria bacterium]
MELSPQYFIVGIAALGALVVALFIHMLLLRKRLSAIFKGKSGNNLDNVLRNHLKRTERLEGEAKRHMEETERIKKDVMRAFQKMEILRFNSFEESGAQQSFSLALLDGNRNGFVLTNLQLRDAVRLYAKQIEGGISRHKLSDEEEAVLKKALQQ